MLQTIADFFKSLFSPSESETELPAAPDLSGFVPGVDDVDQPEVVEDADTNDVDENVVNNADQTPPRIPYEEDDGEFDSDQTPGAEANKEE